MPDERTCTIGATRQDPDVRLPKHWLLEWLTYVVVRLSVCVIQTLHIDTVAWLARGLALVVHDVFRIRVRVTEENIAHAFPQLCREEQHRMARKMWEHMVVMVAEIAQASRKIHDTNWRNHLEMSPEVRRQFVSRLLDPRPLIVLTGHHGNFEIGGLVLGLLGFPTFTVARPFDNRYIGRFVNKFRGAYGQYILSKYGSAKLIAVALEKGHVLGVLGDQDGGARGGCVVEFFGRSAACHKSIALFSLTADAPMLVTYTMRDRQPLRFKIGIMGVVDPANKDDPRVQGVSPLTQWYSSQLEQAIRIAPEQYWWMHDRWKEYCGQRRHRPKRIHSSKKTRTDHPAAADLNVVPHVHSDGRLEKNRRS